MGIISDIQRVGNIERSIDNLERRTLKAGEEVGELSEAVLSVTSASGAKELTWMDVIEEACDVAIMGIDIAMTKPPGVEISDEDWKRIFESVICIKLAKWEAQARIGETLIKRGTPDFSLSELEKYELTAEALGIQPKTLEKIGGKTDKGVQS